MGCGSNVPCSDLLAVCRVGPAKEEQEVGVSNIKHIIITIPLDNSV